MNIFQLVIAFIIYDAIFVILFCVDGYIQYFDNPFVVLTIVVTLLSYFPLYVYYNEASSRHKEDTLNKIWHFDKLNVCLYYCILRGVTLIIYFTAIIIEISNVDVWHSILHFPTSSKIIIIILIVFFIVSLLLTIQIRRYHQNKLMSLGVLHNIPIQITVHYTNGEKETQNFLTTIFDRQFIKDTSNVILVPNDQAPNLTIYTIPPPIF